MNEDADEIKYVTCRECWNEQPDKGKNVACKVCGSGPMPYYDENGKLVGAE